eukprot:6175466-Pleurochrysis_carterae.AAC.1
MHIQLRMRAAASQLLLNKPLERYMRASRHMTTLQCRRAFTVLGEAGRRFTVCARWPDTKKQVRRSDDADLGRQTLVSCLILAVVLLDTPTRYSPYFVLVTLLCLLALRLHFLYGMRPSSMTVVVIYNPT